jgi:hypothetical protein
VILALSGALRNPETSLAFMRRWMQDHRHKPVAAA